MDKSVPRILDEVIQQLRDPDKWCQGSMARLNTGESCDLYHWSRGRVDLTGALQIVLDKLEFESPTAKSNKYREVSRAIMETAGWTGTLSNMNDNMSHQTLMSVLERTLKRFGVFEKPLEKPVSRRERMLQESRVLAPQFGGFVRNQRKR